MRPPGIEAFSVAWLPIGHGALPKAHAGAAHRPVLEQPAGLRFTFRYQKTFLHFMSHRDRFKALCQAVGNGYRLPRVRVVRR